MVGGAGVDRAEAALTELISGKRAEKVALAEVGPQGVGEVEFGVGQLIEEEVRYSQLARRANEQIGVRQIGAGEPACDGLLVDFLGAQPARRDLLGDSPDGGGYVLAPAVGKRERDRE